MWMYIPVEKDGMLWCLIGIMIEAKKRGLALQLHIPGLQIAWK